MFVFERMVATLWALHQDGEHSYYELVCTGIPEEDEEESDVSFITEDISVTNKAKKPDLNPSRANSQKEMYMPFPTPLSPLSNRKSDRDTILSGPPSVLAFLAPPFHQGSCPSRTRSVGSKPKTVRLARSPPLPSTFANQDTMSPFSAADFLGVAGAGSSPKQASLSSIAVVKGMSDDALRLPSDNLSVTPNDVRYEALSPKSPPWIGASPDEEAVHSASGEGDFLGTSRPVVFAPYMTPKDIFPGTRRNIFLTEPFTNRSCSPCVSPRFSSVSNLPFQYPEVDEAGCPRVATPAFSMFPALPSTHNSSIHHPLQDAAYLSMPAPKGIKRPIGSMLVGVSANVIEAGKDVLSDSAVSQLNLSSGLSAPCSVHVATSPGSNALLNSLSLAQERDTCISAPQKSDRRNSATFLPGALVFVGRTAGANISKSNETVAQGRRWSTGIPLMGASKLKSGSPTMRLLSCRLTATEPALCPPPGGQHRGVSFPHAVSGASTTRADRC
eukprot:GHVT01025683.1.p2 GENE.GHVT01025683.1~~GHVT01025683.1.p2  ORF type:complete len:500 (+),score=32.80 GHVT01025683.1:9853-11352(+)